MILPLEAQVCPLALAQRLKELGAPQDSYFAWYPPLDSEPEPYVHPYVSASFGFVSICAAYTVAELGAMLPDDLDGLLFVSGKGWAEYSIEIDRNLGGGTNVSHESEGATEAEARAALLIALVESGVVKFEKVAT